MAPKTLQQRKESLYAVFSDPKTDTQKRKSLVKMATMATMTTATQELLICALNLSMYYSIRTYALPDVNEWSCMPTLYFIKVALECGIPKNTKALAECFPYDRDWWDQADFRGHLRNILKEDGQERIVEIANRVGRDAISAKEPWFMEMDLFRRYFATTSEMERMKLLWEDDDSKGFCRETLLKYYPPDMLRVLKPSSEDLAEDLAAEFRRRCE